MVAVASANRDGPISGGEAGGGGVLEDVREVKSREGFGSEARFGVGSWSTPSSRDGESDFIR